jgi:hypothetical protein
MPFFSDVDAPWGPESMKFPVNSLLAGNSAFRDGFARDCLLQRGSQVRTRPHGFGNLPPGSRASAPPIAELARHLAQRVRTSGGRTQTSMSATPLFSGFLTSNQGGKRVRPTGLHRANASNGWLRGLKHRLHMSVQHLSALGRAIIGDFGSRSVRLSGAAGSHSVILGSR